MRYASNADLPPGVRNHLPEHAQDIWREAFNHAWTNTPATRAARKFRIASRGRR